MKLSDFLDSCILAESLLKESYDEIDSIKKINHLYNIENWVLISNAIVRYRFHYNSMKSTLHFYIDKGFGDESKKNMSAFKKYLNRKFKGQITTDLVGSRIGYFLNLKGNVNCLKELISERVQIVEEFFEKEPKK